MQLLIDETKYSVNLSDCLHRPLKLNQMTHHYKHENQDKHMNLSLKYSKQ